MEKEKRPATRLPMPDVDDGSPSAASWDGEAVSEKMVRALAQHGREAVSFQALEPGVSMWTEEDTGAVAAYVDTGAAWVAVGLPLAPEADLARACQAFAASGRRVGRRVVWFAAERQVEGLAALQAGRQPEWSPAEWPATLARSPRLREQLRRARAAGVSVRALTVDELAAAPHLRAAIDRLAERWLSRRRMEPLRFLVTVALWQLPRAHRYFVAERRDRPVAFLSLVPIPARGGFLFEDLLRDADAPNGTSELLIDAAMRAVAAEGATVATLGLVPLAAPLASWQRLVRAAGRGLYDFRGLEAFKTRLGPHTWRPIWLLVPGRASVIRGILDVLRAFTARPLFWFAWRTVTRHPGATCVALAAPLVPWTLCLALASALGKHGPRAERRRNG